VSETAIEEAQRLLARREGIWTAPEAAATVAALVDLRARGVVGPDDRVVLVLTGAGIKNDAPPLPSPIDLAGTDDDIVERVRGVLVAEPL
jgi:threonine synthase